MKYRTDGIAARPNAIKTNSLVNRWAIRSMRFPLLVPGWFKFEVPTMVSICTDSYQQIVFCTSSLEKYSHKP